MQTLSALNRVVLIEDSPDYAVLAESMLKQAFGDELAVRRASRVVDAERELRSREADCVVLDFSIADSAGLEALERVQAAAPDVPVVALSRSDDERLAVSAVRGGAQDYLVKRTVNADRLGRAVRYAIERKRAELELSRLALHDALTGLPNRTLFEDRLGGALAWARRRSTGVAVLFLDLDGFKQVNDSLGHHYGDRLLVHVAERLRRLMRSGDTVARFGGDEFVVLCDQVSGRPDAAAVAERLEDALSRPFALDGHEIPGGVSVGIALSAGGGTPEDLIKDADRSMYRAKHGSRSSAEPGHAD